MMTTVDTATYLSRMSPLSIGLRKARGKVTQAALAKKSGVQQGTISKIEAGKTRGIDFDTLEKLAKALGVHAADLLVETPAKPNPRRKP